MRLNKFLSKAGLGSRRYCDELIANGKIIINDKTVDKMSYIVDLDNDTVIYENKIVKLIEHAITIAFNKPTGYVCSKNPQGDDKPVYDLLPTEYEKLFYVGRLDKNTEGLLILTNDGELCQYLTHPSHKIEKEYHIWLDKPINEKDIMRLMNGVKLEEGIAKAHNIHNYKNDNKISITLKQGWKRQIRRMLNELDYKIRRLLRVRIGDLNLYNLPSGKWKNLSIGEIEKYLRKKI